jgi:hypothetical protein
VDPKLIESYPAIVFLPVVSSPARRSEWPLALQAAISSITGTVCSQTGNLGEVVEELIGNSRPY